MKMSQSLRVKLVQLAWMNGYTTVITVMQIAFRLCVQYWSFAINMGYALNQVMTFYFIYLLNKEESYGREDLKLQFNSLRSTVFVGLFIVDIAVSVVFYNVGFVSYDKFEVLFVAFCLMSNALRVAIVVYSLLIERNIEVNFG